jgi:hypothetical protein
MKRRAFISLFGNAAIAWPLMVRAQQGERVRTIGILASQPLPPIHRFARKLRDYGYARIYDWYLALQKVVTSATR